jgi:hypothetical protein
MQPLYLHALVLLRLRYPIDSSYVGEGISGQWQSLTTVLDNEMQQCTCAAYSRQAILLQGRVHPQNPMHCIQGKSAPPANQSAAVLNVTGCQAEVPPAGSVHTYMC